MGKQTINKQSASFNAKKITQQHTKTKKSKNKEKKEKKAIVSVNKLRKKKALIFAGPLLKL